MRRAWARTIGSGGGAPPPAPTITPGANYAIVDSIGGGQNLVWAGTNLDTVTSVDFGGTAGTIVSQTLTSITVSAAAHAAGGGIVVTFTNAGGSATDTIEYVDPTAFVDWYAEGPDYNAGTGTWTVRKGADATSIGVDPTGAAGALGGLQVVDFDGTQHLRCTTSILTYVDNTSLFDMCLFKVRAISTDSATLESNCTIVQESTGQNFGLELRSTGPKLLQYAYKSGYHSDDQTIALTMWELAFGKYDGSSIFSRLGSAAWSAGTAVASPLAIGAHPFLIGKGGAFFDGQLAILAMGKTPPSDANITKMIAAINQRWGTSY